MSFTTTILHINLMYKDNEIYSIAGKQLKLNDKDDVSFIAKDLESKSDIKSIDLSGNTVGVDAAKAISEIIIKYQESLIEINLSDLFTSRLNTEVPESLNYLLTALLKFPNLLTINLSDNAFGLQTIDPIENYLSQAYTIQHLILSNNGMGPFSGERIGKCLYKLSKLKTQKGVSSLKTFVCGRNRLENGSMKYLTLGLINHKDLQEVRLYQNGIRPIGIYTLMSGLKSNTNLKVLDLQDNTLTYLGCLGLSESLGHWNELTELNLNDCLLKSKGFVKILSTLESGKFPKFHKLQLQYNELDKASLSKLYDLLSNSSSSLATIDDLEINGNKLEDDDELIEQFQQLFEDKQLDELDEMEGEDSDEEDEDEEDEGESIEDVEPIDFNDLARDFDGTSDNKDQSVDNIADDLSKTHLK